MRIHLDLKIIRGELPGFREELRKGKVSFDVMNRMKEGWINEYSAHVEYCMGLVEELIALRPKRILECGSGFTTLLLTVIAQELGATLTVLEDTAVWSDIARRALRFLELPYHHIVDAPLCSYDGFDWYNVDTSRLVLPFDFVACDGPPGTTRGGRAGLLPVLGSKLSEHCVILLDDAGRQGEGDVLDFWRRHFELGVEMKGEKHLFARVALTRSLN